MKHLIFIINPKSGVDRKKSIRNIIENVLDLEKYSFEIQHTEYEKHGIALAKKAVQNNPLNKAADVKT